MKCFRSQILAKSVSSTDALHWSSPLKIRKWKAAAIPARSGGENRVARRLNECLGFVGRPDDEIDGSAGKSREIKLRFIPGIHQPNQGIGRPQ